MSNINLPFFESPFYEIWEYRIELFNEDYKIFMSFCNIQVPVPKSLKTEAIKDPSLMAVDAICHVKLMHPEHRYRLAKAFLISTMHIRDDSKTLEYIINEIKKNKENKQ